MVGSLRKLLKRLGLPRWIRLRLPLTWMERFMPGWGGRTYVKALLYPIIPLFHHYRRPEWREFTRWGMHFRYDISHYNEWWAYYNFTDKGLQRFVNRLKSGHTVLDVGANVGYVTALAAHAVKPEGRVICFEPHPTTFSRLTDFLKRNEHQLRITAENMGLGHETTELAMYVLDERHSGANTFLQPSENHAKTAFSVPVETLDNYVNREGLTRVDGIKIDTEGFEYRVLLGAEQTLRQHKPLLFIELSSNHLARDNRTVDDVFKFLRGHGYELYEAKTGRPVRASYPSIHFDLLAVSNATSE